MMLIHLKKYLEEPLKKEKDNLRKRRMTEEERMCLDNILKKEKERYEKARIAGGVDECGQYTAFHHRNW